QLTKDKTVRELIRKEVRISRNKYFKRKKRESEEILANPVAFWIKEDRLLDKRGKELTIILKTRGCSWALGEEGGCSMCGYITDSACAPVKDSLIISQFNYAWSQSLSELQEDSNKYIVKIFNSGSFFDDDEISPEVRDHIYEKISEVQKVEEVVVESRVEYLSPQKMTDFKEKLPDKYLEIGIGLETVDNFIRNTYINKGLQFDDFINKVSLLHDLGIGIRAYLLFKPPFLNEHAAINDCVHSVTTLKTMDINTISINPVNIQKGSYIEYLWQRNMYRAPWFYSLFAAIQEGVSQKDLKKFRLISDPSGAGTMRGIHNCSQYGCNNKMKEKLHEFVMSQDLQHLEIDEEVCSCKTDYELQKDYSYHLKY
ncbi:MAG: archaeosine biosynthesis radical SAM protein RaSEA, partial [Promethearchaeia archaeon]